MRSKEAVYSKNANLTLRLVQDDDDAYYTSPGIRQTAGPFMLALQKTTVYCTNDFESIDCMMLSNVLRHRQCKTQRLILHEVDGRHTNFEFDLLAAIAKCKSLRSIYILSGTYSEHFIVDLMKKIQEENPRCVELYFENVNYDRPSHVSMLPQGSIANEQINKSRSSARSPASSRSASPSPDASVMDGYANITERKKIYSSVMCTSMGLLISDYFNYAVPGISQISLHNCSLRDSDLNLLIQGLQINTSLKHIVLSCNLFEDDGFIAILTAVLCNTQKTSIRVLDFSNNFIRCRMKMRKLLDDFHGICDRGGYLEPVEKTNMPNAFTQAPLQLILHNNNIIAPYELPLGYNNRKMLFLYGVPGHALNKDVKTMTHRDRQEHVINNTAKVTLSSLLKTNKIQSNSLPVLGLLNQKLSKTTSMLPAKSNNSSIPTLDSIMQPNVLRSNSLKGALSPESYQNGALR